uniref:Uncharacterized protein n=1 Tax=Lepeophtheirus salmonis TaxID=72036 RepID=A0A0K2U267_LEPSM
MFRIKGASAKNVLVWGGLGKVQFGNPSLRNIYKLSSGAGSIIYLFYLHPLLPKKPFSDP